MIHWGIAGTGKIAHSFVKDLALCEGNVLTAVGSRYLESAAQFAGTYGANKAYGSYQGLFEDPEVDVVYIASPHTLHAEMAIMAMDHKKHVLCEKPLGMNGKEVAAMLDAAKRNRVFLMEALWSRFNPTIIKAKALIEEGAIGKVGYVHADFAFYGLDRDEQGRVLNTALGGGSLLDIGIYPIFLSYLVLGMPETITARSRFYRTGAEIQTSMIFEYTDAHALLYSGLTSNSEMKAQIAGSRGSIFIKPRWHEATGLYLQKDGVLTEFELGKLGKGYTHEIKEVQQCLEKGALESRLWSHQNSRDLCALLDRVREKAGIIYPFEQ
jgi:scyllo-inositol 2-dehydrogenase (NADP+)